MKIAYLGPSDLFTMLCKLAFLFEELGAFSNIGDVIKAY